MKKARDSLIAQAMYPSIDAVRMALGNTGSKTTIHKYLKQLEEEEGGGPRKPVILFACQRLLADMRILIVDDSLDTCILFKEYFTMSGHEVDMALSAKDALTFCAVQSYDAIVLDILLPDLDGYALACRVRQMRAFLHKPRLIAVSGTSYDPTHPLASAAGFDAYLIKPANLDVIGEALGCGRP